MKIKIGCEWFDTENTTQPIMVVLTDKEKAFIKDEMLPCMSRLAFIPPERGVCLCDIKEWMEVGEETECGGAMFEIGRSIRPELNQGDMLG